MAAILDGKSLTVGTCYYPEHWPETLWENDLRRMLDAGIQVIRIAEFAWNKTEPEDGVFTYDFFDRFLDLCEKTGMKVIFGTPTATPPAWLTKAYPEVLNADVDGLSYHHGTRRHYNYNSPVYQAYCTRIVTKLAEHYAGRSCIIGWQIDNELNCEVNEFYSEADTKAFRLFLRDRYGSLDALNDAWGTVFWNQTYTAWEQIDLPKKTPNYSPNPHERLDYLRFISYSARRFAKLQSDILRRYIKPDDFVTTNGLFGNLDNHAMTEESLDFYTYDSYPNFGYCLDSYDAAPDNLRDRWWSRSLAEVRSISPKFGIMEQQSGANGWNTRMEAPTPRPGQMTLWAMQSVAHGADFISFFRWRTATIGTEIYWHGILDYSGRDNKRMAELRDFCRKLDKLQQLAGSKYQAQVGLVRDYDNVFDSDVDKWHKRVAQASENAIFTACQLTHTPMDYVYLDHVTLQELQAYKVLFCPHPLIMTAERAAMLQAYVEQGGTIVFGCRSGQKDVYGHCTMEKLPGLLADLTAADVPEYSFISPASDHVTIDWNGTELEAAVFIDQVEPTNNGTKEASYTSDLFEGCGALVSHEVGRGKVYAYGSAFNEQAVRVFLQKLEVMTPWHDVAEVHPRCEIAVRVSENGSWMFVLNYMSEALPITLKRKCTEMLTGTDMEGSLEIAPYGVMVFRLPDEK